MCIISAASTIALVGASGNLGRYVLFGLKNSPYGFEIRTISRKSVPPKGSDIGHHFQVDFDDEGQVRESLRGCSFLINCMGTSGDYHRSKVTLVHAAAVEGVYGYITSDFGVDYNTPSEHFDHSVWREKKEHLDYAKRLGLRTLAICPGLFLEEPFGAFNPWHGFDYASKSLIVAGTGNECISVTSKLDIGAAVAQSQPLGNKDYIRISGNSLTPNEIIDIVNLHSEADLERDEDASEKWKVRALEDEEERQNFQSTMNLDGISQGAKSIMDHHVEFDPEIARQVAGRVFRAMGDGTLHFAENDNELVNPDQRYWKWTQLNNFKQDTKPKTLW
ncbi:hypothetical protein ACJZ2D_015601 [Fusarium nematophilum]